jgi:hypothetical protein
MSEENSAKGLIPAPYANEIKAESIEDIIFLGSKNIVAMAKEEEKEMAEACIWDKPCIRRRIEVLYELAGKADEKPYLARLRSNNYFRDGSIIIAYVDPKGYLGPGKAGVMEGIVIENEHLYNDGVLEFQSKGTQGRKDMLMGGSSRADILLKKDYEYLRAHTDFADAYFRNTRPDEYSERFREIVIGK